MDEVLAPLDPDLRACVLAFLERHHLPAAACGLVRDGKLAWSYGAGYTDRETLRVPDAATLFRIASITKTFTATAILQLRDEGRLRLDDPLVQHVPEFSVASNPFGPIEEVTLRRLLLHTSGLQGEVPFQDPRREQVYRPEELLEHFAEVRVVIRPDTAPKYSNLGFELLGEVVRRVGGSSLPEYIATQLTGPLGMNATVYDPGSDPGLAGRMAVGHQGRLHDDSLPPAATHDSVLFEADGGLWSTVEDMATWLVAQSWTADTDRRGTDKRILDGRSVREAHRPWILYRPHLGSEEAQGLSWYTVRRDGIDWTGHAGSVDGFNSKIHLSQADGLGVIVLLNTVGPASGLAFELGALAMPAHRAAAAVARAMPAPVEVPGHWHSLLGIYRFEGYGPGDVVEIRGGKLVVFGEGDEEDLLELIPTDDPYRFVFAGGRPAGEDALFLRAEDGSVDAANFAGYPVVRLVAAARPPS